MGESTGRRDAALLTLPPSPAVGDFVRQNQTCYSSAASSSASAASSSSDRREAEEEEEERAGKWRRKSRRRREVVVRAIRDMLPAAPSCWGYPSAVRQISRRRNPGPRDTGNRGDGVDEDDDDSGGLGTAATGCCCVCVEEKCSLEPNPSANGKEDAAARSLVERNDFYSDDCNPHASAAVATSPGDRF